MTISYSTIDTNTANGNGGGIDNDERMIISSSAIISNFASESGGGVYNDGTLTIPDSTIALNSAGFDGAGIFNDDVLTAVNTTIAYNSLFGGAGAGLFIAAGESTTLDNTIVAQNGDIVLESTVPDDIAGTVSTTPPSTFNLIGIGGSGGLTGGVNGNQVGVASPGLGPFGNYGGPTPTIALLPGSPAVDAGSCALDGLPYDQRGPGFVRIFDGTIDIGAFELQPATVTAVSVDWGTAGTAALETASDGLRLLPGWAEDGLALVRHRQVADHLRRTRDADLRGSHPHRPQGNAPTIVRDQQLGRDVHNRSGRVDYEARPSDDQDRRRRPRELRPPARRSARRRQ